MSDIQSYGANPGSSAVAQTTESAVWTGREGRNEYGTLQAKSTLVDAGSSPTTVLRPGLLLGKITATGLLEKYDPTATDGSQVAYCVLAQGISMLDSAGSAAQRQVHVLLKGILQVANLLLLDNMARKQLLASGRYIFDDAISSPLGGDLHMSEVTKAADYTVVAGDAGTLFTATAAVNFTLPAIAAGLGPFEFLQLSDNNMAVLSAGSLDNIVADGDAAADSVTFSTAAHKIGSRCRIRANAAGTKWYFENLGATLATVA